MSTLPRSIAETSFRSHERYLWSLCYRMTGDAADADDLVQETFARAIERPPADQAELRPWLVRVAMNLGRDLYRQRKRRGYTGTWLPSPVPDEDALIHEPPGTEGRYELLESVSLAFLTALEALKPNERAVLILRDVFDYSVRETAEALALSEANVKTTHLRARRAMEAYDGSRPRASAAERDGLIVEKLGAFLGCLAAQDVEGIAALLADDVRTRTDGGGVYRAALRVVTGKDKVARFYLRLAAKARGEMQASLQRYNGAPAIVVELSAPQRREAPRFVLSAEVGGDGKISELAIVLAPRKLVRVFRGFA